MTQEEFLLRMVEALEAEGIPLMVVGSHGSSFHSHPRTTNDVDLVIDPTAEQLERFIAGLGTQYYASLAAAQEALRTRSMFNVIDLQFGWKADLIVRKDRPYSVEEFQRKQSHPWQGRTLEFASPEDVILTKLEWNKITPSERQVRDALNVASVHRDRLDRSYMRHWAGELGVADMLEEILAAADAGDSA